MDYYSKISFPGLNIGEFSIHNIAFEVGSFTVMWYGLIICIGIICAFFYFSCRAGKAGIKFDDVIDMTLITVPSAIIGARLYYIAFYGNVSSFLDAIAIWRGGLAIYGAIIGGAIAVLCVCLYKKMNFFRLADMIIPGVMLGQLIGRWGNFCNGEAFGSVVEESSPLYFIRMGLCNKNTGGTLLMVHPTFLYESLWNLLGFILINVFYKKKKYNGEVFLWYLAWYGFGRAFIEQLRTDSLYLWNTDIRVSSLLGAVCFIIAAPLAIILGIKYGKLRKLGIVRQTPDVISLIVMKKSVPVSEMETTTETIEYDTEEFERQEEALDGASEKAARKGLFDASEESEEPKEETKLDLDAVTEEISLADLKAAETEEKTDGSDN